MSENTERPSSPTPDQVLARFGRVQRLFWLVICSAFCAMSLMSVFVIVRSPDLQWGGVSESSVFFIPVLEVFWYAAGVWLSLSPERRQLFVLHVVASVIWMFFLR